ncbi:Ldh family oxidoreductase [Subtercola frigoramans]|uniref:Ldh family oxidoreductase n=1 Tax=Subtercola frigoramans TaxID=120298 RepID=UPI001960B736|nr:Ldh family oxidoreductase [Subtercola frigoramans]
MTTVDADVVLETIRDALRTHGASDDAADVQAKALFEAELRAHPSHGVRRLAVVVERMRRGLIDVDSTPLLTWVSPAVVRVDGQGGFGPVVMNRAIAATMLRADETGIAMAVIANSSHIGMLAPYVERIAERGQIAVVLTTSEALVHAWGGREPIVGTNPIGIGVPTGGSPLVLDMSTAAVSMGKVIDYAATSRPLAPGWAIDSEGAPTTNAGAALGGAISPFGGAKGYALGITLEAMIGFLTTTSFGTDIAGTLDVELPSTKGDLLICISAERLGLQSSLPLLARYLTQVRDSGSENGSVDIPGDRARRTREENLRQGVLLDQTVWADALAMAKGGSPRA